MNAIKIIILISLVSCKDFSFENNKASQKIKSFCEASIDSVSALSSFDSSVTFKRIKKYENQLELKPFIHSADSFLMRFWFDVGLTIEQSLFEIRVTGDSVRGEIFTFIIDADSQKAVLRNSSLLPSKKSKEILYACVNKNILTIPDMQDIKLKPQPGGDGSDYCVEIYSRNRYRFIRYWCPFSLQDEDNSIKEFISLLNYLKETLKINFQEC